MGIWALLTKDLMPSRADLRWKEPWLYRIRLRGDLAARLMLVASGWMLATAALLGIFSASENPGGIDIAFGLGAAAGLGPVALFLFFTKHVVSGEVKIIDGVIQRKTQYTGFSGHWTKTACWDLNVVDPYQLLTADATGRSFHLLLLEHGDDSEVIGVPTTVDLPKLVAVLGSQGSGVTHAEAVPDVFLKRVSLAGALVALVVSGGLLAMAVAGVARG
jgi:hypothetical protein